MPTNDIDRVLNFSKTVTVMNQGEVLMSDTPEAVRADRRVQEIYTGKGIPDVEHRRTAEGRTEGTPLLCFEAVNTLLRQEPHPARCHARRPRGRDRGPARPQRHGGPASALLTDLDYRKKILWL